MTLEIMGPELGEAQKLGFKSLSWSTSGFTQPKFDLYYQ
jgi:hypothetical protein